MAQKYPKKCYFADAESLRNTFRKTFFNLTTANAIMIKLSMIMYVHEIVNRKLDQIKNRHIYHALPYISPLVKFCTNLTTFGEVLHGKRPKLGTKLCLH